MLLLALAADGLVNRTLAAEAEALRQEARVVVSLRVRPLSPEESDRQRLDRFYASFPDSAGLPDRLIRINGYALARQVAVDRAEYRSSKEPGTPLERVTLNVPAHGDYPTLRAWLGDVLTDMPELAVESLSLKRSTIADPVLEAQVHLAIFLKSVP
ncbi:MAG TPA: hypothetical protein PLN96_16185 [Zoogloea sp.]|uniref:hypothetical protein n=1 Tax=Zoogloea sp. TaxID=49181 RepID=UPI002B8CD50E|nr:hypothetical protein [Zoogloea sp.]HMW53258.1 hypothetical protein [Rhodocyclaceae bacterium]HMY48448.1 hypothetical protein [Rhodocyclaceae bacterium]HMZ75910.1 hypothetical protein [Rhodocyclaceae bacterium]HNB63152.1 hypothetical protein [Rhodocyclaceae bacterium]HND25667.1 hypothetical protein [Rhodocyclaceae bacterium]